MTDSLAKRVERLREKFRAAGQQNSLEFLLSEIAEISLAQERINTRLQTLEMTAIVAQLTPSMLLQMAYAEHQDSPPAALRTPKDVDAAPETVKIDPDEFFLPHSGFHRLEHSSDGTAFRWTDRAFSLDFTLRRTTPKLARILFRGAFQKDQITDKDLLVHLDGKPTAFRVTKPDDSGIQAIEVPLPPVSDRSLARLGFVLPWAMSPKMADPASDDVRVLGMLFLGLTIVPHSGSPFTADEPAPATAVPTGEATTPAPLSEPVSPEAAPPPAGTEPESPAAPVEEALAAG